MQLLYRTVPPSYAGCTPSPTQASPGLLGSLWCSLFGAATPPYRIKNVAGASAPAPSRCFWELAATPAYKSAPIAPSAVPSPDQGDDCETCANGVPTEIHLW